MIRLDNTIESDKPITYELIRGFVLRAAELMDLSPTDYSDEIERMIRLLEAEYNVYVGSWAALENDDGHVKWLEDVLRKGDARPFWDRYYRYIRDNDGLPPPAAARLDEITNDILGRLEAPNRPGQWDRRGLVAGQVQSGKTANYIGLIAKALDSGYKLVVVLAGVHNSLRSQTQSRIDAGILGIDTRKNLQVFSDTDVSQLIGVGKIGPKRLFVNSFTSSKEKGDFNLAIAQNLGVQVGGSDPIVLVVKKNKAILENLYEWATKLSRTYNPETKKWKVLGVPVLVIDDEADHASIDTSRPQRGKSQVDTDPTTINRLIRTFLETFDQTAYVAYTATPFANIFIAPEVEHPVAGRDLFPTSFIVNLPASSSYIGPARVFGLSEDTRHAIEYVEALPLTREVDDYQSWLPDNHKSSYIIDSAVPESLKRAVLSFLLGGAIRALRGQGKRHNSMLVHVTRFTDVQTQVVDQVEDLVSSFRNAMMYGEGSNQVVLSLARDIYNNDLVPTSRTILDTPDVSDMSGAMPEFDDIWGAILAVCEKTEVYTVNGKSDDALEYIDKPDGVSVVAVGGDKLSRGLTLEGLSVSYYLRASKMYDTLMQMGRWFGYRSGYLDVCRLYTTPQLIRWYVAITAATEELQAEFEVMAATNRTPREFGLRVRRHPGGLLVTSPTKLRHSSKVELSYSGQISEPVTFNLHDAESNWTQLRQLTVELDKLSKPDLKSGLRVWRDVPSPSVIEFLDGYHADESAVETQPRALTEYINSRNADGELISWTVAIADVDGFGNADNVVEIASRSIGLTRRTPRWASDGRIGFRRVGSPGHEIVLLDRKVDSNHWLKLLQQSVRAWEVSTRKNRSSTPPTTPSGYFERRGRSPEIGLMIIYPLITKDARMAPDKQRWNDPKFALDATKPLVSFALSFPESPNAEPISYQVNSVFWENQFGIDDEEEDEGGTPRAGSDQ